MGRKELVVLDKQKRALNLLGSPGDSGDRDGVGCLGVPACHTWQGQRIPGIILS